MPTSNDKVNPSDEHQLKILRMRAQQLAQKAVSDEVTSGDLLDLLKFTINGELYAVETKFVREVQANRGVTPIPCTPSFIAGVHTVRGEIISVLHMNLLFGLKPGSSSGGKIIIVNDSKQKIGFLVDEVVGVSSLLISDLQPPLSTISHEQAKYVRGIAEGPLVLIDMDALLNDGRIIVEEEVED